MDCHFLLQVIFPTQGWNPHLLEPVSPAFQADSLPLSHVGSSLSENTIYVKVWYVKCADFFFLILLDITRSSSKKAPAVDISTSRCMNGLAPLILTKIEHYHLGGAVFLFVLPIWWYLSLLFSCPFPWLLESMNIILKNMFIRHLSFSSRNCLLTFTYFYQNRFLNQFLEHSKCYGFNPLSAICIAKIVSPKCHWLCLWFFNMCKI